MSVTQNVLDTLDTLLQQAKAEKQASLKQATDGSQPTTHPVMDVPDGTQPAKEGERSKENLADVKKDVGGNGNTGQRDASAGAKKNPIDNIGTVKMESDEVKGNVADPKATKDKPPESPSHQSNETFNEKYSSLQTLGKSIVDGFTALLTQEPAVTSKQAAAVPATATTTDGFTKEAEEKLAAANEYPEDAQAGYVMAEYLLNQLTQTKEAQVKVQEETAAGIEHITKTAQADADLLVNYLIGREKGIKTAHNMRKSAVEGGPAMAGAEETGEVAPPEGGGMPEGGMPPGAGGQGAPQDEEHTLDALAQALDEAGVSPEELAHMLEQAHGGGGGMPEGGMPPGAGGPPGGMPEGAGMPEEAGAPPGGEIPKTAALRYASLAIKAAAAAKRQTKIATALRGLRK